MEFTVFVTVCVVWLDFNGEGLVGHHGRVIIKHSQSLDEVVSVKICHND